MEVVICVFGVTEVTCVRKLSSMGCSVGAGQITGTTADVKIQHDKGRLSPEEVEEMVKEAERMREADEARWGCVPNPSLRFCRGGSLI